MLARIGKVLVVTLSVGLVALGGLCGWNLYRDSQARPPELPAAVRQARQATREVGERVRGLFDDRAVRPAVLAVAAGLETDVPATDPGRPLERELIEAVAVQARLVEETSRLASRLADPAGPGPPEVANPAYALLMEQRRKLLPDEQELRERQAEGTVDPEQLAVYLKSPVSNQRFAESARPIRPAEAPALGSPPDLGGRFLVLVPKTDALVQDRAFCQVITDLQNDAENAPRLVGGGVWLVGTKGRKRWPADGTIHDTGDGFRDANYLGALRSALREDELLARGRAELRTLLVWRSNANPEDNRDPTAVVQVSPQRKPLVKLYWVRAVREPAPVLEQWFTTEFYLSPSELRLFANALGYALSAG